MLVLCKWAKLHLTSFRPIRAPLPTDDRSYQMTVYLVFSDSLRYTSALSVALAVVFVVITAGVTIVKLIKGSITMPRLLPELVDQSSFWKLFTTVPVIITAYICHYSGM